MKKVLAIVMCLIMSVGLFGCNNGGSKEDDSNKLSMCNLYMRRNYSLPLELSDPKNAQPVILDCDMDFFDGDAMALAILARAHELGLVNLLGITITDGKKSTAYSTNSVLRQLELMNIKIPVYIGGSKQKELVLYHDLKDDEYDKKWGYSKTEAEEMDAAKFLVRSVISNPKKVTIISAGSAINIEKAIEENSDFASRVKEVIFTGGSIRTMGETDGAGQNIKYNVSAMETCLTSAIPEITMISYEAGKKVLLDKDMTDEFKKNENAKLAKLWTDNRAEEFDKNPSKQENCIDAIAAVFFLDHKIMAEYSRNKVVLGTEKNSKKYGKLSEDDAGREVCFFIAPDEGRVKSFIEDLFLEKQYGEN